MSNFYIADTHFFHKNVIKFDNRPFSSVEEMNEKLISNWNNVVRNEDTVYILGDFIWSNPNSDEYKNIISHLNGWKVIVLGNHDPKQYSKELNRIGRIRKVCQMEEVVEEDGSRVICSHYPIPFYRCAYQPNFFMFYGHIHITRENTFMEHLTWHMASSAEEDRGNNRAQLLNVGCMMSYMNYTPQPFETLKNYVLERNKAYGEKD